MYIHTIIIGAGPSGIQLGSFLQQGGYDYLILEQHAMAGSFFHSYPHTGKLISINKKYTGYSNPEFNLRHDWNSLLSEKGPLFTNYSNDYYPHRDDLQRYLHDFSIVNQVRIQYQTTVISVHPLSNGYQISVSYQGQTYQYTCVKLIVAKGLSPKMPTHLQIKTNVPIYHYGQYPRNYFLSESTISSFTNKSLAIIGDGNSAMELANHFVPYCSKIVVYGRSTSSNHPWSISTNYTGDVRGVYLGFFDTFMLKSMNGYDVLLSPLQYEITHENNQFKIAERSFDHMIFASGWEFDASIFSFSESLHRSGKYPRITPEFESTSHPGLYFIGSLSHSLDVRKSSGGFIHGFRYLIRYFYQLHYQESFPVVSFPLTSDWNAFSNELFLHFNRTSAMYQMHGRIGTIFYKKEKSMNVIYDVSIDLYHFTVHHCNPLLSVSSEELVSIITFEFGKDKNNFINQVGLKKGREERAELLHPVIRIYQHHHMVFEFHFDEDLLAEFTSPYYHSKMVDILSKWY
jgi:thioredoxin reductase